MMKTVRALLAVYRTVSVPPEMPSSEPSRQVEAAAAQSPISHNTPSWVEVRVAVRTSPAPRSTA